MIFAWDHRHRSCVANIINQNVYFSVLQYARYVLLRRHVKQQSSRTASVIAKLVGGGFGSLGYNVVDREMGTGPSQLLSIP